MKTALWVKREGEAKRGYGHTDLHNIMLTIMFQIPTHPQGRWSNSLAGNAIADLKPLSGPSN